MKTLLLLLLFTPLVLAANSMRNMDEFKFTELQREGNVKLEELKLHDEPIDYVVTLTSQNKLAQFEWMCELVPFFYPPELKDLSETNKFDLVIDLNNTAIVMNHYTLQVSGILISKTYLANHHQELIDEVIHSNSMEISLDNVVGKPRYDFRIGDMRKIMIHMLQLCSTLY